ACIQLDAGHFESDAGGVGRASRRDKNIAGGNVLLASAGLHQQTDALTRSPLRANDVGSQKDFDLFGGKEAAKFLGDFRVLGAEELRPVLDHRNAAAEALVRLGEFEADIPAAEDNEVFGHTVEFEQLDVSQRPGIRKPSDRRDGGMSAQVEEDVVA